MTEALEQKLRLGVNIDHVATLRNARNGGGAPSPLRAARMAAAAGADGITAHLREDRRHIRDRDIARLRQEISLPLNLEMAATDEMVAIAIDHLPHACCLVPEKREELTTEGGLDAARQVAHLAPRIATLVKAGIRVSLFLDPDPVQLRMAHQMGSSVVELHTGAYCDAGEDQREGELRRIVEAAAVAGESLNSRLVCMFTDRQPHGLRTSDRNTDCRPECPSPPTGSRQHRRPREYSAETA